MYRLLPFILFAGLCLTYCSEDAEGEIRDRLERQAESYENLILDREREWVSRVHKGMLTLLFTEAERGRSEADRTALALKLENRIERFDDGVRAIALRTQSKGDPEFRPFIASWSVNGGEYQRAVTGEAEVPEAARRGLQHYEGETSFTSGTGADDERRIQVHIYYSNEKLKRQLEQIRAR